MSIVSNALKKTQKQRAKELFTNTPVLRENSINTSKKNSSTPKLRSVMRILLFVIFLSLLGVFVYINLDTVYSYIKSTGSYFNGIIDEKVETVTSTEEKIKENSTGTVTKRENGQVEKNTKEGKTSPVTDTIPDTTIPAIILSTDTEQPAGIPVLNGIMYSETAPKAIMNNKIVQEGDLIGGFTVLKIYEEKVIIELSGKKYDIDLE